MNKNFFLMSLFLLFSLFTVTAGVSDGYYVFRSGDYNENGETYCRIHSPINGNGHDVGCLWRENSNGLGMFDPLSNVEPIYCSQWVQYYFDEEKNYSSEKINRIYCHFWLMTHNGDFSNVDYGFNVEGEYAGYDNYYNFYNSNERPAVGEAGNYALFIYDRDNFNYTFNGNELYNLTFIVKPQTSTRFPQIISSPNQKSFCIINPGDNNFLMSKDTDGDSVSDYNEMFVYYTDPYDSNTDDDIYTDKQEAGLGKKGYNPYDDGLTKVYKIGENGNKGFVGVLDNQSGYPIPFDYYSAMDRELTSSEYSQLRQIPQLFLVKSAADEGYTLGQVNFQFNISEKPEEIKSINIYSGVNFGYSGQKENSAQKISIKNGQDSLEIPGSSLGYRNFFLERLTNNFGIILNNQNLYFREYGILSGSSVTQYLMPNFAEVWVTRKPEVKREEVICNKLLSFKSVCNYVEANRNLA